MAWAALALATYLLAAVAVRGVLAGSSLPPLVLGVAAAFLGVVWASFLAASLEPLAGTRLGALAAPVVRPRGLAVLGAVAILLFELLLADAWPATPDSMRDPPHEPAADVGFVARPGVRIERPHDPQSHGRATGVITVNSDGFRGPEWPRGSKPPGELRVAVLGGSAVFYGLTDDRTIPALLAAALSRRVGAEVVPVNGGIVSANSAQEAALLDSRILALRPDVVVVYDGFNDMWDPLYYDGRIGAAPDFVGIERPTLARLRHLFWRLGRSIGAVQAVLRVSGLLDQEATPYASRADPSALEALPADAAAAHLGTWRRMAAACRAAGVSCVFALQPTPLYRAGAVRDDARTRLPPREREAIASFYRTVEGEIGEGEPRAFDGATAVSLAGVFGGSVDGAFWDAVHLYDEANEVVAERLAEVVCRSGPLRCR